jgi:hypothetical protein
MRRAKPAPATGRPKLAELDELIEEITTDAYGDQEQLWAFRQAFEDEIAVPCDTTVVGEPVSVVKFDYDGNERRGLTAKCRRPGRQAYLVAASDVVFPDGTGGARYVAAYRKWMGLPPFPRATPTPPGGKPRHHASASAIDPGRPVELVVLSAKGLTARCRLPGAGEIITLRSRRLWVPGELLRVQSGDVVSSRIHVPALGLIPLRLEDRGTWNPAAEFWGDEGRPIEAWAKPIIAHGPRPKFEMEQVLPGYDYQDPEDDPIGVANDLKGSGDTAGAYRVLMDLCEADLRCLDAHSHLGNLVFDRKPGEAVGHYEVGFRIGELSLPEGFDGLLPWGHIDNRPFLRCMHGFGLCLWRLGRFPEASRLFKRMLWMNPSDDQGVRFLIDDVRAKRIWEDRQDM